jgi:hypothetical protein
MIDKCAKFEEVCERKSARGNDRNLDRIAQGWPASEIDALKPWTFKPDAIG